MASETEVLVIGAGEVTVTSFSACIASSVQAAIAASWIGEALADGELSVFGKIAIALVLLISLDKRTIVKRSRYLEERQRGR